MSKGVSHFDIEDLKKKHRWISKSENTRGLISVAPYKEGSFILAITPPFIYF